MVDGPRVVLVGAGPGDPGLLTLRGKECLEQAEFVLYDQLVAPHLLDWVPATAEKVCVRELGSAHVDRGPHILKRLVEEARQGKRVVRLKGGDPLIFGRGGEEAEALREAGIEYEIVPGVTAALAAGAYLDIPLTHRAVASAVAFVTGHEHPGKPTTSVEWAAFASFPGTIVIYMGMSRLSAIVAELLRHGKPPDTPTAVVSKVTSGEQQSVVTTLVDLESAVRNAGLTTPAVILIGKAVARRPPQSWHELRPLVGVRVLVTRPRKQASAMMRDLELLGAIPSWIATVEIQPPLDWSPTDAAIARLRQGHYQWVIFTSSNGVEAFLNRIREVGADLRVLGSVRLAVVGSATAATLRQFHLEPDIIPTEGMQSEYLVAALQPLVAGGRVLIAQADRARPHVQQELFRIAEVDAVTVYRQADVIDRTDPIFDALRRGEVDVVTLTSPAIAEAFLGACDEVIIHRIKNGQIQVISNSPRLTQFLADRELPATQSANPTTASVLQAILAVTNAEKRATPRSD